MESGDSGVTTPVLRVTAEITELKERNERRDNRNYTISPSLVSKECKNHSVSARKKCLKPLYGYNPYERSNYGGSYTSIQQNPKNNVSSFTQRVMSAKLLRMKQLQNQLHETQAKLNEVLQENRTLKTLQQRQDNVLKKYEGNQEQLPQLMKSHHEEIRILNEKYKQLRNNYRELENRLKQKDIELTNLREQHKHLLKLSKDKQLGEREKLAKKVEETQNTIEEQRRKIFMLNKKLDLEEKSYNHQLSQEAAKQKKLQIELNTALETVNNLKSTLEAKEKLSSVSFRRPIQNSGRNPQMPLRVSIRQPQQQAQSNIAAEHDESETTDDSFIMNYRPAVHRSSSLESDSSGSSKGQNEQPNGNKSIDNSHSSVSMHNTSLKNGLKLTKNSLPITTPEQLIQNETITALKKDEHIYKQTESKVRRKLQAQRSFLRAPAVIQTSRSLNKLVNGFNKTAKDSEKNNENLNKVSIDPQEEIKNGTENPTPSNSKVKSIDPGNTDLPMKIEKVDTEMKLDLDSEFKKYFNSAQLTDEAINEFYNKDFREEIDELEKRFKELNDQNNEKIKTMKAANRLAHTVSSSSDTESEEIPSPEALQLEEIKRTINETSDLSDIFTIRETKPLMSTLGESQKADLLKALNNIDEGANTLDALEDRIELLQLSTSPDPELTTDLSYLDKVNEVKKSFSRTRRKSEVLKDLFGSDATALKS